MQKLKNRIYVLPLKGIIKVHQKQSDALSTQERISVTSGLTHTATALTQEEQFVNGAVSGCYRILNDKLQNIIR